VNESSQVARHASESVLRQCLVEGGAAQFARARRRRGQALLVSLALQAALLAALALFPLLATSERVPPLRMTPVPLPFGSPRGATRASRDASGPRHPITPRTIPEVIYQPPQIPSTVQSAETHAGRSHRTGLGNEPDWGIPDGVLPPGAGTDTRWLATPIGPVPPPAVTQRNRVVRSEGVQQALLVHRIAPVYPVLAMQVRLEGTVQLRAVIGRDGAVHALEVLSGHPILAQAAREAVRQWRYQPTLLGGKPVEVETYITVIFQLQR